MKSFRLNYVFLLVTFSLITSTAYLGLLRVDFIGDDYPRIVGGAYYMERGFMETLRNVLQDRPFLVATIYLNYFLGNINPFGYKLLSLILHIFMGFLLFNTLWFVQSRYFMRAGFLWPGLLTLIFLLHPVNSQSLVFSIQRGVILAAIGGVGALLFFVKFIELKISKYYLYSILCYLVGILSKPSIFSFPLILLLFCFMTKRLQWKYIKFIIPFLLFNLFPAFFYFIFKYNSQAAALNWDEYFFIQAHVIFTYLKLFFLPNNLHFFYDHFNSVGMMEFFSLLGHFFIFATGLLLYKKGLKLIVFCILSAYLAFAPESGFLPIEHVAFEHRTYIPYVFLFLTILVAQLFYLPYRSVSLMLIYFIIIALFSALTINRISEINDPVRWELNTYKYRMKTRENNLTLLNGLFIRESFGVGGEMSKKMKRDDLSYEAYDIFSGIFSFPSLEYKEKKGVMEKTANFLINRDHSAFSHNATLHNCFQFIIEKLPMFTNSAEGYLKKLEPICRSQMSYYLAQPKVYRDKVRFCFTNLHRLNDLYDDQLKENKIVDSEFTQFLNVIGQIGFYFPEEKVQSINKFTELKRQYPDRINLIENISKNYFPSEQ